MTKENMILLHEIDSVQEGTVRQRLAMQRGCAFVLVHPIYFGRPGEEQRAVIENIVAHTPNPDASLASDIQSDQDGYLARLSQGINHRMFNTVGFVFEEADRLKRVDYLQSLNPALNWVVIPTLEKRAQPKYPDTRPRNNVREWQANLTKMQALGLQHALVGGCYCIVTSEAEPLRNEGTRVGCVNEAYFKMLDSRLFRQVQIAGLVTYAQELS